jgi:hypothetical protein
MAETVSIKKPVASSKYIGTESVFLPLHQRWDMFVSFSHVPAVRVGRAMIQPTSGAEASSGCTCFHLAMKDPYNLHSKV